MLQYDRCILTLFVFSHLSGKLMFSHLDAVLRVMTVFDMFNDQVPLRASNRPLMADRKFRTSDIAPFAANVIMVLYSCGETPNSFVIKFFVNEQEVALNGCDGFVCSYDVIRERYSEDIDHCDFAGLCSPGGISSAPSSSWWSNLALLTLGTVLYNVSQLFK